MELGGLGVGAFRETKASLGDIFIYRKDLLDPQAGKSRCEKKMYQERVCSLGPHSRCYLPIS